MDEIVISLLAPVAAHRIQRWVEEQVDELRAQASASGVRLGRLVPSSPSQGGDWLIAVAREERDGPLEDDVALAMILTDMAMLGLRPRLFVVAREPAARRSRDPHSSGAGAARRQLARHARPACRRPA